MALSNPLNTVTMKCDCENIHLNKARFVFPKGLSGLYRVYFVCRCKNQWGKKKNKQNQTKRKKINNLCKTFIY